MFSWYAFPDSELVIPVTFALRDTQKVRESIEVTYSELAYPMKFARALSYFQPRTIVMATGSFSAPPPDTH
jgi:hypothetical protein